MVRMERAAASEKIEQRTQEGDAILKRLQSMAWRWAQDHEDDLRTAVANIVKPSSLRGRKGDNWKPLLAIADVAGGHWPETARAAAAALTKSTAVDLEPTIKTRLLRDTRTIFDEKETDAVTPTDLVNALNAMPDAPWSEYKNGKWMTTRSLFNLRKDFKIAATEPTRAYGEDKERYYVRADFEDAWSRYLPPSASPACALVEDGGPPLKTSSSSQPRRRRNRAGASRVISHLSVLDGTDDPNKLFRDAG